MPRSTGLVLAAGGIAAINEVLAAPVDAASKPGAVGQAEGKVAGVVEAFNWRIIPATGILAVTLAGLEKVAPGFAVGLAGLTLMVVLLVPMGKGGTPIDNITKLVGK